MTKREICERLMEIRDYARVTDTWPHDNAEQQNLHLRNAVEAIAKDLGDLLLDLAAPEEEDRDPYDTGMHDEYDLDENGHIKAIHTCENEPKPEPKSKFPIGHPLHMSTEEMKAADTALFTQTGGRMGKDWRNAEERREEEHPCVIAKPRKDGVIEWCWCQKCYAQADVVHDPFGDGNDWGDCKKCGVSFRLKHKREEGEDW